MSDAMSRRRFLVLGGKATLGLLVGVGCGPALEIVEPPVDEPFDPFDPVDPPPVDPPPVDPPPVDPNRLLETLAVASWRASAYDTSLGRLVDLTGNGLHAVPSDPPPVHLRHEGTSYLYFPGGAANVLTLPRPAAITSWRAEFLDHVDEVGSTNALVLVFGGSDPRFVGKRLKRLTLRAGADGPVVGLFDASLVHPPHHDLVDAHDNVWTIERAPTGLACALVDRPLFLLAEPRHFTVPSHPRLAFAEGQDFTVVIAARAYGEFGASAPVLMAKGANGATPTIGWSLHAIEQTLRPRGVIATGGAPGTAEAPDVPTGVPFSLALRRTGSEFALALGDVVGPSTAASGSELVTSDDLRIGRGGGSGSTYAKMEFIGGAVFPTSLTTMQLEQVVKEFGMDAIATQPGLATKVEGVWLGVPA
jgi:hypothetical protein